jgi:hypothetical protein
MAKRRSRLWERIEIRRRKGQTAAEIARYVHNSCGSCWSRKYSWTPLECEELEKLDLEAAERRAKKAAKAARAAAEEDARRTERLSSRPPDPPNLGRSGLSPAEVREILGCTEVELDRWAADGRLGPDGTKFYHKMGGAKSLWGRAWRFETVDNAKAHLDDWRARDIAEMVRWVSEAALFGLVHTRFPDAVRCWSPDWLGRQSVDIYVPSINAAFEYQGEQHYKPISIFGGEKGFWVTLDRDARKRNLLALHGVRLVEWRFDSPITEVGLDRVLASLKNGTTLCE